MDLSLLQNPAWIGVIGTLTGGILVGVFALLNKRIDLISESRKLTRAKLEELHATLIKFIKNVSETQELILDAEAERVRPRELFESIRGRLHVPLIEISAIQRLYAYELNTQFYVLFQACSEYAKEARSFAERGYVEPEKLYELREFLLDHLDNVAASLEDYIFASKLIPRQGYVKTFESKMRHVLRLRTERNKAFNGKPDSG